MRSLAVLVRVVLVASLCSLALPLESGAQVETLAAGAIDWSQQVVKATGIGAPNLNLPLPAQRPSAIRAAKNDAYRNLLETIEGVYVTSETTVQDFMTASDVVKTKVEGLVKGAKVLEPRYMSDGTVEVEVLLSLTGHLAGALLPEKTGEAPPLTAAGPCPTCGQPWPAEKLFPSQPAPGAGAAAVPSAPAKPYTGVIVDARGLGTRPAMTPKIVNEAGEEVYGTGYIDRDYAVRIGVVGYGKDLEAAKANERVKDNPLVIKGLKVAGPAQADVVISDRDALILHGDEKNFGLLEQCRVMILVD